MAGLLWRCLGIDACLMRCRGAPLGRWRWRGAVPARGDIGPNPAMIGISDWEAPRATWAREAPAFDAG